METNRTTGNAYIFTTALLVAATAVLCGCVQQPSVPGYVNRTSDPYAARRWTSRAFTPAHATFGDAAKHFLSIKPKPQQPIDFPHIIHRFDQIGILCQDCHTGVLTSARAGIPSINICMSCHEDIGDPADSRIQRLRDQA